MAQNYKISGRATKVYVEDGMTKVKYHDTDIVSFNEHCIILNTGGWWTVTTKTRMQQAAQQFDLGYNVFQKNYEWFLTFKGKTVLFDGASAVLDRKTGVVRFGR